MPRIRTIKPEFWSDEKLAPLSPIDRLVFLGLLSFADDGGRLLDNVKAIDGFIFPESEDTSRESLDRLAEIGRIVRYASESGQHLVQIVNWKKHQKIDHPSKYVLPAPSRRVSRDTREGVPEGLAKSSHLDLGPTTSTSTSTSTNDPGPATSSSDGGAAAGERECDSVADQKKSGEGPRVVHTPIDAAIALTSAANRGISERWGEQTTPVIASASSTRDAVEELQRAGVPIEFARDAIFTYCGAMKPSAPPRSLGYFVEHVKERWAGSQARAAASQSDAQLLPTDEDEFSRGLRLAAELMGAQDLENEKRDRADVYDRLGPDLSQKASVFVERHPTVSAFNWWALMLDLLKDGRTEPADIAQVCDDDQALVRPIDGYNIYNRFREFVQHATRLRHAGLNEARA